MSKREIKRSTDLADRLNARNKELTGRIKELEVALDTAGVPICQVNEYPPVPQNVELFQHHYGWRKPVTIHQWGWSIDFNCWRALVTFADGWYGWTYPCLWGWKEVDFPPEP